MTRLLTELLVARGFPPEDVRLIRHTLDPSYIDVCGTISDVYAAGALKSYERMQTSRKLGDRLLMSFLAESNMRSRLVGFRSVFLRSSVEPPTELRDGGIVERILDRFLLRAENPLFYDLYDLRGFDDLFGKLVILWPVPAPANSIKAITTPIEFALENERDI